MDWLPYPALVRAAAVGVCAGLVWGQTPDGAELFESRVRPLLAEKCYPCHSEKVASGGLRLDDPALLNKGGHRGPPVQPGDPESSLLLRAVSWGDSELRMPPGGRLDDRQIADLAAWIAAGATVPDAVRPSGAGSKHWAFQPVRKHDPPPVQDTRWPFNWVDRFVLAKLEAAGLHPAKEASKAVLIRRVTFDLTGLPPTPEEVDAFLRDTAPGAYERLVERLLASPHYGERWARHWLDLVRYAETDGHEFDREKPNAWRYRDYVIRAFNQDVPYDRFVREHIAGDLLQPRRMTADGSHWESPLGTAFFGLGEERNAADDLVEVRADKVDNQIDVLSKTFLGLTVACARCHDHKFDPIPTKDYYALAGVLDSKQSAQACLDSPSRKRARTELLNALAGVNREIARAVTPAREKLALQAGAYLRAAIPLSLLKEEPEQKQVEEAARAAGLHAKLLRGWALELRQAEKERDHLLYPLAALARGLNAESPEAPPKELAGRIGNDLEEATAQADPAHPVHKERRDVVIADFRKGIPDGWHVEGPAFARTATGVDAPGVSLTGLRGEPVASSAGGAGTGLTGYLYSPTFPADRDYVHVRLAGTSDGTSRRQPGLLRAAIVGDGRDSVFTADDGRMQWKTSGFGRMRDAFVYVELTDQSAEGYLAVEQIVLSNAKTPPMAGRAPNRLLREAWAAEPPESVEATIALYGRLIGAAFARADDASPDVEWIRGAVHPGLSLEEAATVAGGEEPEDLTGLRQKRSELAAKMPAPIFGMAAREDEPHDVPLYIGGSHRNPGELVPRGFLSLLVGPPAEAYRSNSGRQALARSLTAVDNPLTARVFVNRVWQHHFGQGIVRTPDNFGLTGARPTHPELLDALAARFVEGGWRVKDLHRLIVLSRTYRMDSRPDPAAANADGDNRLLHHMPVRRLEAETVRDAILAVAGTLDRTVHGQSVPPHISDYQDGRGKPVTGPLDGEGRRSIYIGVRRNFLPPLFVAFDYPMSVTTIGKRGVSTVPSQALILMNNEFVLDQARRWAERITASLEDDGARLERMFLEAYGRKPQAREADLALTFLARQRERRATGGAGGGSDAASQAWADLAHSLLNSKEFLFVR